MVVIIVTVTSHKGGVGKTTSAIHLAAYMAEVFGEGSVVLVDTDPNESSLEWAERGEGKGLPFRVVGPGEGVREEHQIYDSQGRLHGGDLMDAAADSDLLVVPTTPDYLALNALGKFLDDLDETSKELEDEHGETAAPYVVLLTMVPWYEKLHCPGRKELERNGIPTFRRHVQTRKAFQYAAANGATVAAVKGGAAQSGWVDYQKVGEELLRGIE